MEARNFRRFFRAVVEDAEIPGEWTTRELRQTFVSLMSDQGASDELIADLVGHAKTSTTRTVYRHQLRPVITTGRGPGTAPAAPASLQARRCLLQRPTPRLRLSPPLPLGLTSGESEARTFAEETAQVGRRLAARCLTLVSPGINPAERASWE